MNISAKLTSKGQITLPKQLRDALGLKPGDVIDFAPGESGGFTLAKHNKPDLEAIIGLLARHGGPNPLGRAEIDTAVDTAMDQRAIHGRNSS
jgi:AbrB family looped-hinge helix DNA binding protein